MRKIEIINAIESILSEAHSYKYKISNLSRALELHPSQMPYCGLRDTYRRMTGDFGVQEETLSSSYFTSVGTAVHLVFQKAFGYAKQDVVLIGDWKCVSCKKIHRFKSKPKSCSCGKPNFIYRELGGIESGTVYWHCDGVLRIKTKKKTYYLIVDFKTSSIDAIRKYLQTGVGFPYTSNVAQIKAYCVLVERKYKIKVSGAALIYLARDHPLKNYAVVPVNIDEDEKEKVEHRLLKDIRHFQIASELESTQDLKVLIKEKPCRSRAEYKENMYSFFNPCPLDKVCFSQEKLVKTLRVTFKKNNPIL